MTEAVWIALIGLGGVCITAVVGPAVVALVNHLITTRNEARKKGLEVAEAQARRIKALERDVRLLKRQRATRTVHRPTARPARKGDRP